MIRQLFLIRWIIKTVGNDNKERKDERQNEPKK